MDAGQLRAAAERFLPPGRARWDVARVGVRAGRDLRLHLDELRQSFAAGRPRGVGSYAGWLAKNLWPECAAWPSPASARLTTRPRP